MKKIFIIVIMLIFLHFSIVLAETIYIPVGGGGQPAPKSTPINLTLIKNGEKHFIKNAEITPKLDSEYPFDIDGGFIAVYLSDVNKLSPSFYAGEGYYNAFIPIWKISRLVYSSGNLFTVKFRDNTPSILAFMPFKIKGKEDLGDFGIADFKLFSNLSPIDLEIIFPDNISKPSLSKKSNISAIVTTISQKKHYLTDIRNNDFEFKFGSSKIKLSPEKIDSIDIIPKGEHNTGEAKLADITLKTGAQKRGYFYGGVCGKGPQFYESIESDYIKSIKFMP